jgi:hypothetical protein
MQDEHGEDMGVIIPPTGPNPYYAQHAAHQAHIGQQLAAQDSEAAAIAGAGGPGALAAEAAAAAEAERLHLMMMVVSDQQGSNSNDPTAGVPDLSKFVALSPPIPGAPAPVPPLALGTTPNPPAVPPGMDPLSMLMAAAAQQQAAQQMAAPPPPTHTNTGSRPASSRVSQAPNLPTVLEAPMESGDSPSVHAQAQRVIEAPEFTPEVTPVPEGEESQVEHIPVAGEPSGMMMEGEQSEGAQQQGTATAEATGAGDGFIPQPEVTPEATEAGPATEPSTGVEASAQPAGEEAASAQGSEAAAPPATEAGSASEAAPAQEGSEAAGPSAPEGEPSAPPETYAAAPKPVPYRHTAARAEVGVVRWKPCCGVLCVAEHHMYCIEQTGVKVQYQNRCLAVTLEAFCLNPCYGCNTP